MSRIKLLVMDVDGTLTDGGVYISDNGEAMKKFYIKDGYAIKHILPYYGIIPAIITGRTSEIVKRRSEEIDIHYVMQGYQDKLVAINELKSQAGCELEEIAYIGDDLNDFEVMRLVGLKGCPADAVKEIKNISDYITSAEGGRGAVREFIEWIVEQGK